MIMKTAIFAGGCFWCTEAVFKKIDGVIQVTPGYIGGNIKNPCYREVAMGLTGHAEAVKIDFDQDKVSYDVLLEIFFATHDPTSLNRQGNDIGTQYRSEVFYTEGDQKNAVHDYITLLEKEHVFTKPIVTKVSPATAFYEAEDYHQNYYELNQSQPYCQVIIVPKLKKLESLYNGNLK